MRIGLHLLAIVLIGALTMRAGLAEEAVRDGKAANVSAEPPSGENAARGAAKLDDHPAAEGKGDDSKAATGEGAHSAANDENSSARGAENPDGIDTRMTVRPRRLGGRRDKLGEGETKGKFPARGNLQPRRLSAPEASGRVMRNAIGMSVARPDYGEGARPTGFGGTATGGLAKARGRVGGEGIARPAANPALTATPLHHGTSGGAGMIRPNSRPSGLGGPAKAVAGINGTTIRRK